MRRVWRLVRYARPYALYSLVSVVLMAVVGAMAGLRLYLIKPIFDKVLRPDKQGADFLLFRIPVVNRWFDLHFLVPSHFHNAWAVVASHDRLGAAEVHLRLRGIPGELCGIRYDYRPAQRPVRCSVAPLGRFFQKHSTGMLLSTIINDIERVQYAMSTIMADFLQQFFTLLAMTCVAISFGGILLMGAAALFTGGGI